MKRRCICLAAYVAQGDEYLRIAFTGNNGADDLHAGGAGDIADDMVQLQVHEGECLLLVAALVLMLHVLDMGGGVV